jgi:beta-galactosidase
MKSNSSRLKNYSMRSILKLLAILLVFVSVSSPAGAQKKHTFKLGKSDFLLDGQPFQIISGEMHPARIPSEFWRQRIEMAKAMGCNTISAYIFWNYQETEDGVFDFTTGNHNIAEFIKIVQEEGMYLLLRPGPYVCAEWDLGGIPSYLLKIPDIKLRSLDPRYMAAAERYRQKLPSKIKRHLGFPGHRCSHLYLRRTNNRNASGWVASRQCSRT